MKKNVIALAVAAAMTAPLAAQAEVTVSGQLQMELLQLSGDTVTEGLYMTDAQEGGVPGKGTYSAIFFSAAEDLGNGMKALAKYGVDPGIEGNKIVNRDAYVGLTGGFGTVLAGRMSSPYKSSTVSWDPFLATSAQARGNYGMSTLHNGYVDNALAYANKFGPAKVVLAVVFDEAKDDSDASSTSADHAKSLSVNVPVGPVEIALAYIDMTDFGTKAGTTTTTQTVDTTAADPATPVVTTTTTTAAGETGDFTAAKLGVRYKAGAIGVAAQYEDIDNGSKDGLTYMYLNGTYAMGGNTFALAYGTEDNGTNTATQMSIGMIHSFSKATSVHVAYTALDHDNAAGDKDTGLAAGLRVKF